MAQTLQAVKYKDGAVIDWTPTAALTGGEVIQLPDGRAGVAVDDIAAGALGAVQVSGIFSVTKTTSMVLLRGGPVYWDHSANKAHYKEVLDRDFFLGSVVTDAASADTEVLVNLNVAPTYKIDLARDAYLTVPVGTAAAGGFGPPRRAGGALEFVITATSEAQKADALSVQGFAIGSNAIVEGAFRMPNGGSGSASDFSIGVADGTHASNADTIAQSVFLHMDGGATLINAESDDGTTEVAATSTTVSFTAGTDIAKRVEFWMDFRDPADVQIYINGALVLPSSVFNVALATTLYLLAHVEKSSGTETADMTVDWLRVRTIEE